MNFYAKSFENDLRHLLTKYDAEMSVNEDGEIEIIIHKDETIYRPHIEFSKSCFYGFSEEELNWK